MPGEFDPLSRAMGIVGYMLSIGNLAFWFWLILKARRKRAYPHFASELFLFAIGFLFFVSLFTSVVVPAEWRSAAVLGVRVMALLLGAAFTAHSYVAIKTAA